MTRSLLRSFVSAALLVATTALSPAPADGYQLSRRAISAVVLTGASASYRLGATVAEAGPVGVTAAGTQRATLGFWWPSASVPVAVADPIALSSVPLLPSLRPPRPNPFASSARLGYDVAAQARVRLTVYDVSGRLVHTILEREHEPGRYEVRWDGHDANGRALGSAVYYVCLEVGDWRAARKLLIVR